MKHIFITGVTGVLGSALAPILLQDNDIVLHVLIRGDNDEHVQKRLKDLIDYWADDVPGNAATRIHAYKGDAAKPHFNLDKATYEKLLNTITHIIHSAASVKLDMDEKEAIEKVYNPSKQILAFALKLHEKERLEKFEYVSTLGVAGKMIGRISETILPDHYFHNNYERFKYKAEANIWKAFEEEKLPVTIHRPSMIIGHSQTGKNIRFQGFYFLSQVLTGRKTKGIVPDLTHLSLDLIPSDYVAKAIVLSLHSGKETTGRIFHLCSGPDYVMTIKDLTQFIQHHYKLRSIDLPKIKYVSPRMFLTFLKMLDIFMHDPKYKKVVDGIANYFKHIKTIQVFENTKTRQFLEEKNVILEYPENYLGKVFDYYIFQKEK